MLKNFKGHLEHLWRQLEEVGTSERNLLAVLPASSCQDDLRVFAIEQRWQICFASTLERAVDILRRQKIDIVIYDRDLPDAGWRRALSRIRNCIGPAIVIVLSYTAGASEERLVLVMAKGLSLPRNHGVVQADVEPDSPASRADLKRGDVLLSIDGRAITSASQLENHVFRRQPGEKLQLVVLRGKSELTISLVVREHANNTSLLARLAHPEKNLISRLGILCIQIDKDIAAMIPDLKRQYGLIVAAKSAGGQAQFVDLQPGDIIEAMNTLPVASVDALQHWLEEMKPGDPVVLQIERDGRFQYLAFELDR